VTRAPHGFVGIVTAFALLSAPAWAKGKAKPKPRSKPDVVALRFGWPDGLGANVTHEWIRSSPGKPTQTESMTARLVVGSEGQTLRVAFRDWQTSAGGAPAPSLNKMTTVVDKDGTLVRVDGRVSPGEAMDLAKGGGGSKLGAAASQKAADALPVLIQQRVENTWQMLVGTWAGGELELGADYETEDEVPVPLVPGTTLKTKFRLRAERRLDCPGDAAKRCVELRFRSEPDRERLKEVVEKLGVKFGTKGLGDVGELGGGQEFTLVTEPERLIPHRLEITKTVELRTGSSSHPGRGPQVDRTTWTFEYPRAAGKP
jgi:hypothetical protein